MYWLSFWFFKRLIVAERLDTFKEVFLVLCFTQVMALCVSHGHLHDCYFSYCCRISCNCKLKRTKKITAISSLYPEMELSTGTLAWYKYVRKPFSIVLWKLDVCPEMCTVLLKSDQNHYLCQNKCIEDILLGF